MPFQAGFYSDCGLHAAANSSRRPRDMLLLRFALRVKLTFILSWQELLYSESLTASFVVVSGHTLSQT